MIIDIATLTPQQLVCPPGQRRIEYVDKGGLGTYLEVRASSPGVGTAYLRYKDANGKTCHAKIGSTAVLSAADIRREAKRLKAGITLGADPRAEAKARKAVLTYAEFFEQHYLPHAKLHKRSWDRDEELFRLRIKVVFGGKRLNQITRHQLQSFHSALAAEGLAAATANHHIKLLRSSLNLARQWGMLEGENPAAGIPMLFEDNKLQDYLDGDDLQRLLQVLRVDSNRGVCRVALFLLSTGCRLNEALSATWDDVDIERRVFTIRVTNSKSRKMRSIPLNDSAIEVLASLESREQGGALFRGMRGEPLRHIAKVWDRVRKSAGQPRLKLHTLRHSFASFLVNDGRSIYEVSTLLGHSSVKVSERYAHLSPDRLRAASASASARLTGNEVKSAE